MARIIRDRRIVEDDWQHVADGAPLPDAKVIVSLARWQAEREALAARGNVGVALPGTLDVTTLAGDLPQIPLLALQFDFIQPRPEGGRTFDGRAYSQARLLRERLGYRGEIRATGGVFRDAMFYMARCGVNAFEVKNPDDALHAFADFSLAYQGAADDPTPVFRRRRA
ncbi:MAG TPA: DUF934 domain-containing protein [Candidatus Binatia bacterium]|nr:DUF934 domain-containing protein [Candidatus Binatia bacterium]